MHHSIDASIDRLECASHLGDCKLVRGKDLEWQFTEKIACHSPTMLDRPPA
jgi:hypothetical protein